jgi:hypothetical protein
MSIYDAAMKYQEKRVPLVVLAGQEYGSGSSRDWAAKGTKLLGVKAVIARSFERIHRSNLVGMGVLPCQFREGQTAKSLGLDGSEVFDLTGLESGVQPRQEVTLTIHRSSGAKRAGPRPYRHADRSRLLPPRRILPYSCDSSLAASRKPATEKSGRHREMTHSSPSAARFLDACFGRAVDRPPVWMMRQAGRYLPEYREIRQNVSFLDLCRRPDLAVEVSLQPFRRFQPDGVIFFSDILVPVAAMGAKVEFGDGGPHLPEPVRSRSDVDRLHGFDPSGAVAFTGEILAALRNAVGERAAVLGFAGSPWTLASYLIEGGGSRSFAVIKQMMGRDPETLRRLLDLLADVVGDVLSFQIASGAQAVQLFDTWAGELTARDYRAWALPAAAGRSADRLSPSSDSRHPVRRGCGI